MYKQLQPIFEEQTTDEKKNPVSFEKLLVKARVYWLSFAICTVLAIIGAYVYMQYTTPVYVVTAKLLVKDDRKGGMAEGQIFQDIGIKSATSTVDNEIEIFKSKMLMRKVVSDLHLNIKYFIPGKIKPIEVYKTLPVNIVPLFDDSAIISGFVYEVVIDKHEIAFKEGERVWKGNIGDTIALNIGKILVSNNSLPNEQSSITEFKCVVSPVDQVANDYINALDIAAINKQVSIVRLSLFDILPERGVDVVNQLMDAYMQANVDDRNGVAESTIQFIDDRLAIVSEELSGIEGEIKTFKQDNNLTNVAEQSKALLEYSTDNEKELTQQEIQLSIVKSLESFLEKNANNARALPSTSFVQDLSLTSMVNNYNNLLSQKERLLMSSTAANPYIKNIDVQLKYAREDMKSNLSSLRHGIELSIREMKNRLGLLGTEIKHMPATEKAFLEYSRQQNIKQELYLFLLKKREETAISKSSTTPNARIVDVAESGAEPVAPNPMKVFLSAIAIGLLLPAARVIGKELLNIKVADKETIGEYTSMAVIAEIGHNKGNETIVVKKASRSKISEQFRALRTNLQFLLTEENEKTILITSSTSGEGKSFISLNLASTLALSGKKVVLLELDLRKPQISATLGINNEIGFSGYVIGSSSFDEIIKPSGLYDNLTIIPAGVIPPNPSELLMLPRVEQLFKRLREQFDIILIDTAPVGLVTDAQLLAKYADATLYIVRQQYTYKLQLKNADQLYTERKLPKMNIVMNDIDNEYGGYGYGQYGNGYFDDEENQNGIQKIIKNISKPLFKR